MFGVSSWRILTGIAPAIASLGVIAGTGVYISNTPKDSDVVDADRKSNDTKVMMDEKMLAVRRATDAIAEVKKRGVTGAEAAKQLAELSTALDTAILNLFTVGGDTTPELKAAVATAMKTRIATLSEEELLKQLTADVDVAGKAAAAANKLPANDPVTIAAHKYIRHIKSRYQGVSVTDKLRPKWDALAALVPAAPAASSQPAVRPVASGPVALNLSAPGAAGARAQADQAGNREMNAASVTQALTKARGLETKFSRTNKRVEKEQYIRDAKAALTALRAKTPVASARTQYDQAKSIYSALASKVA